MGLLGQLIGILDHLLGLDRVARVKFLEGKKSVLIFEEVEPVVENLIKQIALDNGIQVRVMGRSGFYPSDGELTVPLVTKAVLKADPKLTLKETIEPPKVDIPIPVRTRTQCVGCAHRPLLYNLKRVAKKKKAVVFGDIGCHDAGSFKPLELQSTIYCMGASAPMATGAYFAGEGRPVISMMGDSTFFHLGLNGVINAVYQNSNQVIVLGENSTTAMTGFQPHAGSGVNVTGSPAPAVDLAVLGQAIGLKVHVTDPYDIDGTYDILRAAVEEKGVSLVLAKKPCYLRGSRQGVEFFKPMTVAVDQDKCTGCMICINNFGCPALVFSKESKTVHVDELSCVKCGLCVQVCKVGAIS